MAKTSKGYFLLSDIADCMGVAKSKVVVLCARHTIFVHWDYDNPHMSLDWLSWSAVEKFVEEVYEHRSLVDREALTKKVWRFRRNSIEELKGYDN